MLHLVRKLVLIIVLLCCDCLASSRGLTIRSQQRFQYSNPASNFLLGRNGRIHNNRCSFCGDKFLLLISFGGNGDSLVALNLVSSCSEILERMTKLPLQR